MTRELRQLIVPEGVAGERIDSALTRVLGLSRTAIVKLLDDGDITTDNRAMQKSDRVAAGQLLEVLMPAPVNQDPIPLTPLEGLTVVYNDDDIVVIDKPVGCAAHPSPGWMGPTVVGALMSAGYTISTSGPAERAGVVHRLDAGTSGLMIIAKTEAAYLALKEMFRNHEVEKTYHALIQGHMDPATGTIDAPIDRHPKEDHRFARQTSVFCCAKTDNIDTRLPGHFRRRAAERDQRIGKPRPIKMQTKVMLARDFGDPRNLF